MTAEVALLGIRHHGPGSARAVVRALTEFKPDAILIEGPPEADELIRFAGSDGMRPPVALLCYATGDPRRAAFWPYAVFSPEWQAMRFGVDHDVPVRFCDLPAAHRFAEPDPAEAAPGAPTPVPAEALGPDATGPVDAGAGAVSPDPGAAAPAPLDPVSPDAVSPDAASPDAASPDVASLDADGLEVDGPEMDDSEVGGSEADGTDENDDGAVVEAESVRYDPIGALAVAAGYDDAERWWDDVIEHRLDGVPPFEALAEAMAAVRESMSDGQDEDRDARREAYMRTVLRATQKAGHERIAVVCGAWHVPALAELPPASHDAALLKGLPRVRTSATWVPWTHGRLASWRGYGAGVTSPGWYHHLFTAPDQVIERWLVKVARVLRDEDVPVSSAHVIEGVRLAETLAALRSRPLAGIAELTEATEAVLCEGNDVLVELVNRRVVVGEMLGSVPAEVPTVPLQADLTAEQRRLRLKPAALAKTHDLDLRKDNDLARSRLLHRLRLLGIAWGEPVEQRGSGTFRESWELAWKPEFAIDLVEAGGYGTTVLDAATAKTREAAEAATTLAEETELVERCLLAGLPDALEPVLRALDDRVAADADVAHLLAAVPPLIRTLRYGDVRGTDTGALRTVTNGLMIRACAGLPAAVTALDDDAAAEFVGHLDAVHAALGLLSDDPDGLRDRWLDALAGVADRDDLNGRLAGRLTRLLRDADRLDTDETARRMGLVLTIGVPPARAGAWVSGFLSGGGLLLVHDEAMLALLDRWLSEIHPDSFVEVLPLLRRTFGEFAAPERRAIGDAVRHGSRGSTAPPTDLDPVRGAVPLPTVIQLLGYAPPAQTTPAPAGADRAPALDRVPAADGKASVR